MGYRASGIVLKIQSKMFSLFETNTDEDEFAASTGESGETLSGLRTVKSLNAEGEKVAHFSENVMAVGALKRSKIFVNLLRTTNIMLRT